MNKVRIRIRLTISAADTQLIDPPLSFELWERLLELRGANARRSTRVSHHIATALLPTTGQDPAIVQVPFRPR